MFKCWKFVFYYGFFKCLLLLRICEDEDFCGMIDVLMGSWFFMLFLFVDKFVLLNYKVLYNLIISMRYEFLEIVCEIFVKLLS